MVVYIAFELLSYTAAYRRRALSFDVAAGDLDLGVVDGVVLATAGIVDDFLQNDRERDNGLVDY